MVFHRSRILVLVQTWTLKCDRHKCMTARFYCQSPILNYYPIKSGTQTEYLSATSQCRIVSGMDGFEDDALARMLVWGFLDIPSNGNADEEDGEVGGDGSSPLLPSVFKCLSGDQG